MTKQLATAILPSSSLKILKHRRYTMPQVSNASEAFARIHENFDASKAAGVEGSILFDLTGEGGGQWTVNIADGAFDA